MKSSSHRNAGIARTASLRVASSALVLAGLWLPAASAVGLPSTYPGCASRSVTVAKGGSVKVNLADCHAFGLGVVSRAPAQGTATPGDSEPIDSYVYSHGGGAVAPGATDSFVVLDDNSDFITVRVTIQGGASAITTAPAALPAMRAGVAVQQPLSASGGQAPYRFTLASGVLPAGLSLDSGGLLSGTPTQRGPFNFAVRARDAAGATADKAYGGTVSAAPLAIAPDHASIVQGVAFSQALAATGGVAPYRFQLETGAALPAGLALSGTGVLSGTTQASPGAYPVRLRVSDSSTGTGTHFQLRTFTAVVSAGATPSVSASVSPAAVAEDDGAILTFTVTRSARQDSGALVNLAWQGTARTVARTTVAIPAGATSATIAIRARPDAVAEPDETVVLVVLPGEGYTPGASATATLVDDDLP